MQFYFAMDRRKIFDITPPEGKKAEIPIPPPSLKPPQKPDLAKESPSRAKKLTPLFMGSALLLAGILSYLLIPAKAEIEIWPEKDSIAEAIQVKVSSLQKEGDYIPGELLEVEKSLSQSFPVKSTKVKAVKARGIIRVYNNYSTDAQPLVATTRFVSDDGKLFRTPKRVVVPGGHYEGGKLQPGSVDIEVVADQPGSEYNIDPSTFSIPGFAGTPKYTAFYAKSFEPMQGGIKEEVPQLTQEDLDVAQELLTERVLAESRVAIRESVSPEEYVIIDEVIVAELVDFQSLAQVGQEIASFSAQAKALAKTIVFKESALKDFVKNYIQQKLLPEEELIEHSVNIKYFLETFDLDKGELTLKLEVGADIYSTLRESQLKEMIKNKDSEEIQSIFQDFSQIKKVKVRFWPFWVTKSPEEVEMINILLQLD